MLKINTLLLFFCVFLINLFDCHGLTFSKNQIISRKSGHVQLQGIFPNSLRFNLTTRLCSQFSMTNIQLTQAMIYAIDKLINDNPNLLPGIHVGWTLMDSCSSRELAITALTANVFLSEPEEFPELECEINIDNLNKTQIIIMDSLNANETNHPPTFGILAEKSEFVTLSTASFTSSLQLPQISYFSFSSLLTNRKFYPYFYRTSPPHHAQVDALMDIATKFNWNWGSVVVAGSETIDIVLPMLQSIGISGRKMCIGNIATLYDNYTQNQLVKVIHDLKIRPTSHVISLVGDESIIYHFLQQAQAQQLTGRTFIGSYGWINSPRIRKINADVIAGAIGIDLKANTLIDFAKYIYQLDFCNNLANPWFMQVWRETLKSLNYNVDEIIANCTLELKLKSIYRDSFYSISYISAFVMDAALAFAHALHEYLGCNATYCPPIHTVERISETYNRILSNITFKGITGQHFRFRSDGSSKLSYNVINLQPRIINGTTSIEPIIIGYWNDQEGLKINDEEIVWNRNRPWFEVPQSRCSIDCQPGFYQVRSQNILNRLCCWTCHPCLSPTISNTTNQFECITCQSFTKPNANRTQCIDFDIVQFSWNHGFVIVYYIVASIFIICLLFCWVIIIFKRNTPIIKASNSILLSLVLFFISVSLPASLTFFLPVRKEVCLATVCLVCTTDCGILLTVICKANQISLIFKNSINHNSFRSKVVRNKYQVISIIFILLLLNGLMIGVYYYKPAELLKLQVSRANSGQAMEVMCRVGGEPIFLIATISIGILCSVTLFMGYRTRSLPDNFSEAKFIFLSSLMLLCVSLTGIPAFIATTGILHRIIGSITTLLFGLVPLICLFAPKFYIIFLQPELNTQEQAVVSVANFSFGKSKPAARSPLPYNSTDSYMQSSPIAIGRKILSPQTPNRASSLAVKGITNPEFIENDAL